MESCSVCTDTFYHCDKILIVVFNLVRNFLIPVNEHADFIAHSQLNALVTRVKMVSAVNKGDYFFVHIPDILEFDLITFNCVGEESEILVDSWAVQRLGTTSLQ